MKAHWQWLPSGRSSGRPAAILVALLLGAVTAAEAQERGGERMARGATGGADYNEDGQRTSLPPLPQGMTVQTIRQGREVFAGKGGCVTCHGDVGQGMPNSGSALTSGLNYVPYDWHAIDSLITAGVPQPLARVPIAMPPRGVAQNLSDQEIREVAAYVWAISQVKGEPWAAPAAAARPEGREREGARETGALPDSSRPRREP
ncbi:MAG TPA: cytochrome c [Gemmatimonadales bacterium]|nr:cytochrome c [Gemmatimonadales bacterium]